MSVQEIAENTPQRLLLLLILAKESLMQVASTWMAHHVYLGNAERVEFWNREERRQHAEHAVMCDGYERRFGPVPRYPMGTVDTRREGGGNG